MGTRGTFGVHIDGRLLMGYNQFDSYPSGKGQENVDRIRAFIDRYGIEELRSLARACRLVSDTVPPTMEDVLALGKVTNLNVSNQSVDDWYCLTRETHGDIVAMLECGVIEDNLAFAADSLFCEWGYVLDLDAETFEVYQGFQTEPHTEGRFAALEPREQRVPGMSTYYPIRLIATFPLAALPENLSELVEVTSDE